MKLTQRLLCALSISIMVGCLDDDIDDLDDELDEGDIIITTVGWDNWSTGAAFAMTDPFIDPSHDDGTFLTVAGEAPTDAVAAAEIVAHNADQYFAPAGCATVDRDGSRLTYQLSNCSGPFAVGDIDGTLRVSFADQNEAIAFDIASEDLRIDGLQSELGVEGSYTATGSARTVQFTSLHGSIGDDDGFSGQFNGTLVWTAGSTCVTTNASGEATAGDRMWDVEVDGFTRCATQCPTAGVVRLRDEESQTTTTLTFNGGDEAKLERADGVRGDLALGCD